MPGTHQDTTLRISTGRDVNAASVALARGVATATGAQADAAGALESGAAAGAREFALAAGEVQAAAYDEALLAALSGLDAAESVVQALVLAARVGDGTALLTPQQARLVVAKSGEASARLAGAARASGALVVAVAATGLAREAAEAASAFEMHVLAAAVSAQELSTLAESPPQDSPGGIAVTDTDNDASTTAG